MAILNNSNAISSGGYDVNNSLRFRASASAYLSRTPSVAPTNNKIMTLSMWVKRGALGSPQQTLMGSPNTGNADNFRFSTSDTLSIDFQDGAVGQLTTTQVFRDPSAWYHIVLAIDTTQATAANRAKIYINGSQVTAFGTASYPAQNTIVTFSSQNATYLGRYGAAAQNYFDGYLADVNFIDGSAKTPSDFGETDTTTGVWKPKAYTSTYGTNGFYLKFSDIATTSGSNAGLGKDFSGNANYWTTNNISVTAGTTYDSMTDVPTLTSATAANYAVLNPLDNNSMTITEANLTAAGSTTYGAVRATIAPSSGKWYFEVNVLQNVSGNFLGIAPTTSVFNTTNIYPNALAIDNSTIGGIKTVGVTMDFDNLECKFYVNNTLSSTQTIVAANAPYAPFVADGSTGNNASYSVNFGQRPFSYTPPTGFVALNTFNLPTPTIIQGNRFMDATLWTGTSSNRSIVNASGFRPDLVWMKRRNSISNNYLQDSVRGALNSIFSDSTLAEANQAGTLTSFNSNGFSLGTDAGINNNGDTYVGWQWQAGQGTTSSNTSGSITSIVSVNATAGFSVVTYTGTGANATVGHGLGVAPKMIIIKSRNPSGAYDWLVYNANLASPANGRYLTLNTTNAAIGGASGYEAFWNYTSPTSTTFSIGNSVGLNESGKNFVAYCWAEIAGFSRFGSYTGNGSTDGTFVHLGFRPKYLLTKPSSTTGAWTCYDTSRDTYNVADRRIEVNASDAEYNNGNGLIDFLSNGFKCRVNHPSNNSSGVTYIYMAFAESPFKHSLSR